MQNRVWSAGSSELFRSLANPWLDFLDAPQAVPLAAALNDDLEEQCVQSKGRFYGFGVVAPQDIDAACKELERIAEAPHLRGIILSTHGVGKYVNIYLIPIQTAMAQSMLKLVL